MSEHRLIIDFRGTESQKDAATGGFVDYKWISESTNKLYKPEKTWTPN